MCLFLCLFIPAIMFFSFLQTAILVLTIKMEVNLILSTTLPSFFVSFLQKAIRVTTFMQRLKNSEALTDNSAEIQGSKEVGDGEGGPSQTTSDEGDKGMSEGGVTSNSVSLEVIVESMPPGIEEADRKCKAEENQNEVKKNIGPTVGISPSECQEPFGQQSQSNAMPKPLQEVPDNVSGKHFTGNGTRKVADSLGQNAVAAGSLSPAMTRESAKQSEGSPCPNIDKKRMSPSPDPRSKGKVTAALRSPPGSTEKRTDMHSKEQKDESDRSWCQTQIPDAVAERSVPPSVTPAPGPGAGVDVGVQLRGNASPASRTDARKTDRHSAEFSIPRLSPSTGQGCYAIGSSASLGRHATPYNPDTGTVGIGIPGSYGSPYSSLFTSGMYGAGLQHGGGGSSTSSDWQMDSVIEQIEKQMVAVLEKIEGDMPSLLEQISDCPAESPRTRSTHASPIASRAHSSQHSLTGTSATPPPLPTSPRPALPALPHLSIPPPTYPPPSPPTQSSPQAAVEQDDRDGQRDAARFRQSPRAGMGRGL